MLEFHPVDTVSQKIDFGTKIWVLIDRVEGVFGAVAELLNHSAEKGFTPDVD